MLSILPSLWFGHGNSQKQDPTFTKAQWDGFLRDNLFSGVDHVFRDFEGPVHGFSVIHASSLPHSYSIEIVDAGLNVLPVGFSGDICISGCGVGMEYLGRPEDDTVVSAAVSWRPGQSSGVLVAFVIFEAHFAKDKLEFVEVAPNESSTSPGYEAKIHNSHRIPEPGESSGKGNSTPATLSLWEQSIKAVWEEVESPILFIKLKSLLRTHFGMMISMPDLLRYCTLSAVANLRASLGHTTDDSRDGRTTPAFLRSGGVQEVIDWDLEIASLTDGPKVVRVHCIAIGRNLSGKPGQMRLARHDKIIQYIGDLLDISLGLSDAETGLSLRRANVISTRQLCEMAIPRQVPVHYISTAFVAKLIDRSVETLLGDLVVSPASTQLLNFVDGYAASKWVSEALLEKIAVNNRPPIYVHHLAHVVGEDASELDAIPNHF
ncbi:hypothetical protein GGS24DRAFT_517077 [Hypoxylon argillaceum]|nr:hypothetical protein GGS24DRAFT_517077 [Hypoxylon argillaceum]